ncbi:hypothetical protein ACWFMI_27145 [Nocardiopsis terrae]
MPIEPLDTDALDEDLNRRVTERMHAMITDIAVHAYGAPADLHEAAELPPERQRDHHLAILAATEILRERLKGVAGLAAYSAGHVDGAQASYADLGRATGLTREGARTRFPGAVADAKPGRPKKELVTVHLCGGHPQWDGQTLEVEREQVYGADVEDVGALLMIPDGSFPDHLAAEGGAAVDWRAHYAPAEEGPRTTWVFQGWVPS